MMTKCVYGVLLSGAALLASSGPEGAEVGRLQVWLSWGHGAARVAPYHIEPVTESPGVEIRDARPSLLEPGEGLQDRAWHTRAGAGDVDGVTFTLRYPSEPADRIQDLHILWADLISASDAATARRLTRDPAFHPGSPKVTIRMDAEGTRGFTVDVNQLLTEKAL